MEVAHGVIAGNEFLVQAGVFVVHARVDHGDVNAFAGISQVPGAHGIEGGIASLDRRCLDVAVEGDLPVTLNHDHIVQRGKLGHHGGVHLTEEHGVHRLNHVNHRQIQRFERLEMVLIDLRAVRQPDARRTNEGLEAVVDAVAIQVKRGSLPPGRFVAHPSRHRLLGHRFGITRRHPLDASFVNSNPLNGSEVATNDPVMGPRSKASTVMARRRCMDFPRSRQSAKRHQPNARMPARVKSETGGKGLRFQPEEAYRTDY